MFIYLSILFYISQGVVIELLRDNSFENITGNYWNNPLGLKSDLIGDQIYDELGPRTGQYYTIFKFENQGNWVQQKIILPQSHTATFNLSFWYWALPGTTPESFIVEFDEETKYYLGIDITVNYQPYTYWSVEIPNHWTNIENIHERTKVIKLISNSTRSIFGVDDISLHYVDTRDKIFKYTLIGVFSLIGLVLLSILYSRLSTSKRVKRWLSKHNIKLPALRFRRKKETNKGLRYTGL